MTNRLNLLRDFFGGFFCLIGLADLARDGGTRFMFFAYSGAVCTDLDLAPARLPI